MIEAPIAMKPCFPFAAAAVLVSLFSAGHAADPKRLDRVVAVVNNEVITRLELDEQVRIASRQLLRQGTPLPQQQLLERQLLERMITTRILNQAGRDTGVRVDDTQLDRAVTRLAQENRMSAAEFRTVLEQDGVEYGAFREQVRADIVASRLRDREVESRITVSDAEVEGYLRNQAVSGRNDEFNLLHILITVPEASGPEAIQARRARAEEVMARLRKGEDFKQVSASFSDAPNAIQGGDLGWRNTGRLPNIFAQAVVGMKPGEISPVLRSPNGFHILKLVDRRGSVQQVVVERTRARHILIRLNEVVAEADAVRRLQQIRDRILQGEDFAEMARASSEDGSASRGGDLGWLSPGDTVPEFEQAMNALKPGELSGPVQSPFGWHLIQVVERRTEDLTAERQRQVARQAIKARKTDEAFTEWVRQQRDRAYVDLRLEER
ncbi:MAG: peptidylprolyl isomerase [Betaproteobacteria bacterium]